MDTLDELEGRAVAAFNRLFPEGYCKHWTPFRYACDECQAEDAQAACSRCGRTDTTLWNGSCNAGCCEG
jgi:hypothetical protein